MTKDSSQQGLLVDYVAYDRRVDSNGIEYFRNYIVGEKAYDCPHVGQHVESITVINKDLFEVRFEGEDEFEIVAYTLWKYGKSQKLKEDDRQPTPEGGTLPNQDKRHKEV